MLCHKFGARSIFIQTYGKNVNFNLSKITILQQSNPYLGEEAGSGVAQEVRNKVSKNRSLHDRNLRLHQKLIPK